MTTIVLKIFSLLGKTRETGFEKDGEPLEHWKMLQASRFEQHEFGDKKTAVWRPTDSDFWEKNLSKEEHRVLRGKRTEAYRSSVYNNFPPSEGLFCCRACGLELYPAEAKFDSKTGWPSFGEHVAGNVEANDNFDGGRKRTEVRCRRCKSHLGHAFAETNSHRLNDLQHYKERQCINGLSIYYIKKSLPKGTDSHATVLTLK